MEAELVATVERCRGGQRVTSAVLENLAQEGQAAEEPVSVHSPISPEKNAAVRHIPYGHPGDVGHRLRA